jgi:cytochrome c553
MTRLRLALPLTTIVGLIGAAGLAPAAAQVDELARAATIIEESCVGCHGRSGESAAPAFPHLSGQHAAYIERQLRDFKSGKRKNRVMRAMVEDLGEADFKALAAYYERTLPKPHVALDPALAQQGQALFTRGNPGSGVPACSACHGAQGHGTEALPRLAGQHAQYLERQLRAFGKRERTNDNAVMHTIASQLTEPEIKAVASYISALP